MKLALVVAASLLVCCNAQAQLRKCIAPDGKVTYSDVMCAGNSTSAPVKSRDNTLDNSGFREQIRRNRDADLPPNSVQNARNSSVQACYESAISSPTPFMGNNDEIFKLSDGSIWQVKYEYSYLYAYTPTVIICPGQGKLAVNGKTLNVQSLSTPPISKPVPGNQSAGVIESQIEGEFSGWDGETIFKLTNGQIWQQSSYAYTYHYAYRPQVLIVGTRGAFKLQVEGVEQRISVIRIN